MSRSRGHHQPPRAKRLSRTRKPEEMPLEAWQIALRRQFAAEQTFRVKNVGGEPVFSEFEVTNAQTRRTYRVAIRGDGLGVNYCSCPDFAVNTLGTCKHVEYVLARLRRRRGGKAALAAGFEPPYSEVYLRYGAKREVVFRPGRRCPGALSQLAGRYFDPDGVLRPEAYSRFHRFLARIPADGHEVRCYDDALAFVSRVRDRAELVKRIDRAFPGGADDKALAGLLKAPMYPYQRLAALFAARAGRCLMADDMGLGKTIEAIAAVEILARTAGIERVLIVCPTSLKHQWQQEIERFTSRSAMLVEGLLARRAQCYARESFYKIISYGVVYRDQGMIRDWRPDLVILDEAQRIKNWKTRRAKTVKQLQSDHAFVLTGTPLENRLEELHSIVEFVDHFRLGPMFRFLHVHQHVDENGRVVGYRKLADISRTLQSILIRRTRDAVLKELPERLEKRFFVPMTGQQMRHHEENREIVARIVAKWRRYGFLSEIDQRRLMIALQNMRMACDSTYLLDPKSDHGLKTDELMALLHDILGNGGAKVVVFSQWLRMHELIADRLRRRRWQHVFFHGGVPGPQRKGLVKRFREDPACRVFLATDAGGVGLNLQNASVVANMDLPWNPAVLEQRIGRVHRLGQHRPVRVVHFIAKGTIEEGMLGLLSFKQSMFAGVLDGGKDEVFLGGTRLKRFMDSVEKATTGMPAATPAPEGAEAAAAVAVEAGRPRREPARRAGPRPPARGSAAPAPQAALADMLSAGAALLGQVAASLRTAADTSKTPAPASGLEKLIGRDETTGQQYLKLPLGQGDALQTVVGLLTSLASGMRGPSQA